MRTRLICNGCRSRRKPCDLEEQILEHLHLGENSGQQQTNAAAGGPITPESLLASSPAENTTPHSDSRTGRGGELANLTCTRCHRRGIDCNYPAPDAISIQKIINARDQILGGTASANDKPNKKRKRAPKDHREDGPSFDNEGGDNGAHLLPTNFSPPPSLASVSASLTPGASSSVYMQPPYPDFELSQTTYQHLIGLYYQYLYASIPVLDMERLRRNPSSYPEATLQAVLACGGFCMIDDPSELRTHGAHLSPEKVAEEALLRLKGTFPATPASEQEWMDLSYIYMDRSIESFRSWILPSRSGASFALPNTQSASLYAALGLLHQMFAAKFLYSDITLAARYLRFACALATELDTFSRNHDAEVGRRLVWSLFCHDRGSSFSIPSSKWIVPDDLVEGLALPCEFSDLGFAPVITMDMLQTPVDIATRWSSLTPFGVMCLLFHIRSKIAEFQSGPSSISQLLNIADPRAVVLRTLIDTIELQLRSVSPATDLAWTRADYLQPVHLLILANSLKIILYSPPTVREMISDDGSGNAWLSSQSFLSAFEAASAVCELIQPLTQVPDEMDRLPALLWPCLAKVALLLVALIRKLRPGSGHAAADAALGDMLREKLELHVSTIEHVSQCSAELGALAQVLRALAAPDQEGSSEETKRLEDEILAMFPMARQGSFLL